MFTEIHSDWSLRARSLTVNESAFETTSLTSDRGGTETTFLSKGVVDAVGSPLLLISQLKTLLEPLLFTVVILDSVPPKVWEEGVGGSLRISKENERKLKIKHINLPKDFLTIHLRVSTLVSFLVGSRRCLRL